MARVDSGEVRENWERTFLLHIHLWLVRDREYEIIVRVCVGGGVVWPGWTQGRLEKIGRGLSFYTFIYGLYVTENMKLLCACVLGGVWYGTGTQGRLEKIGRGLSFYTFIYGLYVTENMKLLCACVLGGVWYG